MRSRISLHVEIGSRSCKTPSRAIMQYNYRMLDFEGTALLYMELEVKGRCRRDSMILPIAFCVRRSQLPSFPGSDLSKPAVVGWGTEGRWF